MVLPPPRSGNNAQVGTKRSDPSSELTFRDQHWVSRAVPWLGASAQVSSKIRRRQIQCNASHPQKVSDPNGLLAHREIETMVNMVQVVSSTRAKYSGARPGNIAPFNVLAIRHPAVAGQVHLHPPRIAVCSRMLHCVPVCCRLLNWIVHCVQQMSIWAQPFSTYQVSSARIMWFSCQHGCQSYRRTWISHKMWIVNCGATLRRMSI